MKALQKIISGGLAVCMILPHLTFDRMLDTAAYSMQSNAPDEDVTGIYLNTYYATAGEEIPVTVYANNNEGFASCGVAVKYTAGLTVLTDSSTGSPRFQLDSAYTGWSSTVTADTSRNQVSFSISNNKNSTVNGPIGTFYIRVPSDAQTNAVYTLNLTVTNLTDRYSDPLTYWRESGSVRITAGGTPSSSETTSTTTEAATTTTTTTTSTTTSATTTTTTTTTTTVTTTTVTTTDTEPPETTTTTVSQDNWVYGNLWMSRQPDKTVYEIGETLDLTGAAVSGNGYGNNQRWSFWNEQLVNHPDWVDASAFDSTAAGSYPVYIRTHGCQTSFTVTVNEPAPKPRKGDVDVNGKLEILDAIRLARYLTETGDTLVFDTDQADCNDDNMILLNDLSMLLGWLSQ